MFCFAFSSHKPEKAHEIKHHRNRLVELDGAGREYEQRKTWKGIKTVHIHTVIKKQV